MNTPLLVIESSFQIAWVQAVKILENQKWECNNLIVQINKICEFDRDFHQKVDQFARDIGKLPPKHVAYTIFPHRFYEIKQTREALFHAYNKKGGFYDWTRKRPRSTWGTYFRRMTHYEEPNGDIVNQLDKVISAIRDWDCLHRAAYTIIIPKPGSDTARPRGGPCLNYIAPQVNSSVGSASVSLLCVYRNHDFLERAYGNYWALCNLTRFIATESGLDTGSLTCISSHAYVCSHKRALKALVG